MLIRFTRDFRSAATREQFYEAGAVVDLEDGAQIVAEGAAEAVADEAPVITVDPSAVVLDGAALAAAVLPGLADAVDGDTPPSDPPRGKRKP